MNRFVPRSLLGQVMASVMVALLIAQLVGVVLLYNASRDRLELSALTALTAQLSLGLERPGRFRNDRATDGAQRPPQDQRASPDFDSPPVLPAIRMPLNLRYRVDAQPGVALTAANLESAQSRRLRELLEQEGLRPHRVAVETRRADTDPELLAFARARPRIARDRNWRSLALYVASIQRTPGGEWETARAFEPRPPQGTRLVLISQTALIYAFLVAILYWVIRRITRPLAQLTERVDDFSRAPDRAIRLQESGPSDTRLLIRAHNAMEARIAALLDEKDVMLGAIGHDLKTPLAALRVRIESHPDDRQRAALAANIEEITRTLDDILSLARLGRGRLQNEVTESVDISALAESVVEEFEDLGQPVTLAVAEGARERLIAQVQETWLKRALRNLVSNAVRYGGAARLSLLAQDHPASGKQAARRTIILRVEDDGPGIPEENIDQMLEPFTRGDASRNRATGGAGLGLTLARAIAEAHGGTLVLSNRAAGGLRAELRLPG